MQLNPKDRLILSLDFDEDQKALSLLEQLRGEVSYCKVGLQLFTRYGLKLLKSIRQLDYRIFLDLKFHDIPNTVASAIRSLAEVEIDILNMHALCGEEGMKRAKEALSIQHPSAKLVAVTVLTSLNTQSINDMGVGITASEWVLKLCDLACQSGLDGVVCSAQEVNAVKSMNGQQFLTICPGIRRLTDEVGDQKRITTPLEAIQNGADWLVVGRPIIQAPDPKMEAISIIEEIEKGLSK